MPDLSFKEKSILGSLIAVVAVSAYYFNRVFGALARGTPDMDDMKAFGALGISLLVALIIVEIVYHSVIAGMSPAEAREPTDERDRSIAARAGRNGGVVLATASVLIVGHIMLNTWSGHDAWVTPFVTAHLILLGLVAAQVVEYGSQLLYYRRGI